MLSVLLRLLRNTGFLCLLLVGGGFSWAQEVEVIRYFQDQPRFYYQVELLQHVLNLTEQEYGPAVLEVNRPDRARDDVALMRGQVEIVFLPTSLTRETRFIPVRVPLLHGMLGFRLLLTNQKSYAKFAEVRGLEDFRLRLIGGSGIYWEDFRIFSHNKVVTKVAKEYSQLYQLLANSEIDYFSLGINEIFGELELNSKQFPNLLINSSVAFYYPFPMYFFVHQNNPELAERLEKGLKKSEADGSFRRIFYKHHQEQIQRLKELKPLKIFYLENPYIPPIEPLKLHWWMEDKPKFAN